MISPRRRTAQAIRPPVQLEPAGWLPETRRRLEALIQAGAGRGLPVAFDFDNTLVCGDIGEATLAELTRAGLIRPDSLPAVLAPEFLNAAGQRVSARTAVDLTAYYEAYLTPTHHGDADATPLANGYIWAVEAMDGLPLIELVRSTSRVYGRSRPGHVEFVEPTPGRTSYPIPFFYPEMVDLIATLIREKFAVWIVTASNVWSVRWMVLNALNPLLRERGVRRLLPPTQVLGVATLLRDGEGRLYKDAVLVRQNKEYARLDPDALGQFALTSRLQFPVTTYSGKVAALWDVLAGRPYLAAGDSPGDLAMLGFAEHRLWIARPEKAAYQKAARRAMRAGATGTWLQQPTRTRGGAGFQRSW